jgi:tRNA(Glu) U13 pseudouridine synthase TruD
MAWKIKEKPSDFVVHEVIHDATEESWKEKLSKIHGAKAQQKAQDGGKKYLWMTMRKEDADFFTSIGAVARALSISSKDLGYAGTKDRRAVTSQTISVPAEKEKDARKLAGSIPGLSFSDFRLRNRAIRLGEHEGNAFEITVRNVGKSERARVEKKLKLVKKEGFVNFFGQQRFGSVSGGNAQIGKMLVLGDIAGAVEALADGRHDRGTPEYAMDGYLRNRPGDYVGALMLCPLRMLKLLVHAYQALLWNAAAEAYSKASSENTQIPIVGHATDLGTYPKVRKIVEKVLKKEKIGPEDFKNKAYRELSSRGAVRDFICNPRDLSWTFGADEGNEGKLSLTLSFFLQKGSYATELVRQLKSA